MLILLFALILRLSVYINLVYRW